MKPNLHPANEVPNLKDELDRKCFQTAEWLIVGYEKARLTLEQFSTGMDALFMASAGLIDPSITDISTQASLMVGAHRVHTERHFINGDTVVTLAMAMGETTLKLKARKRGVVQRDMTNNFDTPADTLAALKVRADKLLAAGYEEL